MWISWGRSHWTDHSVTWVNLMPPHVRPDLFWFVCSLLGPGGSEGLKKNITWLSAWSANRQIIFFFWKSLPLVGYEGCVSVPNALWMQSLQCSADESFGHLLSSVLEGECFVEKILPPPTWANIFTPPPPQCPKQMRSGMMNTTVYVPAWGGTNWADIVIVEC